MNAEETYSVRVTRTFEAPVGRVWKAWTDPADLRAWWGPSGYVCTRATADVRPGGRIFVTMKAPEAFGGFEQHSTWNFADVQPPRSIRYVFNFADADGNRLSPADVGIPVGVPADGEHQVILTALGNGRTRLEMTEYGYTDADARDLSLAGLEQCLDKMATVVESGR
jgi:uncharacterized protein YndB with AHSA1/START domain